MNSSSSSSGLLALLGPKGKLIGAGVIVVVLLVAFALNGFHSTPAKSTTFVLKSKSRSTLVGSSKIELETDKGTFELVNGGGRAADQYESFQLGSTYRCSEISPGKVSNCRRTAF